MKKILLGVLLFLTVFALKASAQSLIIFENNQKVIYIDNISLMDFELDYLKEIQLEEELHIESNKKESDEKTLSEENDDWMITNEDNFYNDN